MRREIKCITYDGKIFDTQKEAKKYLDKIYGDKLLSIARVLTYQRYTAVADYIDDNINKFIELNIVKNDMLITEDII